MFLQSLGVGANDNFMCILVELVLVCDKFVIIKEMYRFKVMSCYESL